ncbi:MAG: Glu/Leu/Phe/Val dehydrogenase [Candidatus Wildermuthbacteria bacterium]|nr:Glu/Leu/Phe/Val dehydrogenase [Candidatus Wildermuthbacteria bacterium]
MEEEKEFDQWGPELVVKVFDSDLGMSGFLVVDNTLLGLGKGGVRMTPNVTEEEVRRLARAMTWKNALAGIPFGGAKAGIVWPASAELQRSGARGLDELKKKFVQSFARRIADLIPSKYIAGPDVNTGEKEMQWFAEAAGSWGAATGKPSQFCELVFGEGKSVTQCGIPHEFGSTGLGVAHATKVAAELMGLPLRGATVAIHGFGNVGTFAYRFLEDMGAKVVAIADIGGAVYAKNGFELSQVKEIIEKRESIAAYKGGEKISSDAFWGLSVDILIPASVTDVIHAGNKDAIQAKIIVEGGNIPMKEDIEEELYRRGICIVPDFVANAGGVISSFCEHKGYSPEKMLQIVEEKITQSTRAVMKESLEQKEYPRAVALKLAQDIVLKATLRTEVIS